VNQISTDDELDFLRYWQLVRGRLWMVIVMAIVVTVLAGIAANNMPSIYESTTTLLLAPEHTKTVSMGGMFSDQSRGRTYFNTQTGIIKSRKIMGEVVDALDLAHPVKADTSEPSILSELKSMLNMATAVAPSEKERHQMIMEALQRSVSLSSVSSSKLMKLSYESTSPEMAAKVVNTVAEIYIRDNLEYRVKMAHQATAWMRERATALKKQLNQSEARLQSFIERKGLVNIGAGVASLTSQELTALTDRSMAARATVSELSQRYGAKHPKLIAAKSELARAVTALLRGKSKIRTLGRQDVKLKALQHEVESTRKLYEAFVNRLRETDQSSMLITEAARIIDPAVVPLYPIKPARKKIVIAAFALTLAAGIGLIILLDMLDSTIHSIKQVETKLGMPMLGLLPLLKFKSKQSAAERLNAMANGNHHQFTEAIRTIRTGIMLSAIDNPHKVILVTSALPGEGKSTVAANLAIAMGKLERVLLLDADLRRPTVGKHFGMNTKEKGLSELVSGAATFKDCLERNEEYNIDVMHAGIIPPNPLELLASNRFKAVLKSMENHYDRIIIDSTPVQAVSDVLVMSQYAKGVVYVVKADITPERVIKNCLKRLREVNAPIIGVVLNQVDIKKSVRYGHDGYEGYYDHYGYSATDKKA